MEQHGMDEWDASLESLVATEEQRAAVEWARANGMPPLMDGTAESDRAQSVAAAVLALHIRRRTCEDEPVPSHLEAEVLEAARRAGVDVWERLRPGEFELVSGEVVLAALGILA